MANSVDPDQTPQSAASDLGLHCLQRPICSNTSGCYGICYSYRVATHYGKQENGEKNSLQGKIREFEILLKIRENSGNFKKSYLCKVKIFKFYSCSGVATRGGWRPYILPVLILTIMKVNKHMYIIF